MAAGAVQYCMITQRVSCDIGIPYMYVCVYNLEFSLTKGLRKLLNVIIDLAKVVHLVIKINLFISLLFLV